MPHHSMPSPCIGLDLCCVVVVCLRQAPSIRLGCGHVVHYHCAKDLIAHRWNGPVIRYSTQTLSNACLASSTTTTTRYCNLSLQKHVCNLTEISLSVSLAVLHLGRSVRVAKLRLIIHCWKVSSNTPSNCNHTAVPGRLEVDITSSCLTASISDTFLSRRCAELMAPIRELKSDVERKALMRLEFEKKDKDPEIVEEVRHGRFGRVQRNSLVYRV